MQDSDTTKNKRLCMVFVRNGVVVVGCFGGAKKKCPGYSLREKSKEYPGRYTKTACKKIARRYGMEAEFIENHNGE